jgi:endonuclease/exonuclease/phosphatase family metal-dependent hydrolase
MQVSNQDQERTPDPRRERLCREQTGRQARLDCALESANFAPEGLPPRDELVVLAYNVERGHRWREQVAALRNDPGIPAPDIVLLSEADRGCRRSGYENTAREWAQALGMNYVFGVEFVELPRCLGPGGRIDRPCEHGNAVLSRYPLENARLVRHTAGRSWNSRWQRLLRVGQPRLGGRMALAADVRSGARALRVYSAHFESRPENEEYREAQAIELAEDALGAPGGAVIGGDLNTGGYLADLRSGSRPDGATQALLARGYADAHAGLAPDRRTTTRSGVVIDLIFGRRVTFEGAGVGGAGRWGRLSDHLPVWAKLRLG